MRKHGPSFDPFGCELCHKTFKRKIDMRKHVENEHKSLVVSGKITANGNLIKNCGLGGFQLNLGHSHGHMQACSSPDKNRKSSGSCSGHSGSGKIDCCTPKAVISAQIPVTSPAQTHMSPVLNPAQQLLNQLVANAKKQQQQQQQPNPFSLGLLQQTTDTHQPPTINQDLLSITQKLAQQLAESSSSQGDVTKVSAANNSNDIVDIQF